MNSNLIKEIKESINSHINLDSEYIDFGNKLYGPILLNKDSFHKINNNLDATIVFIDGGNAEIIKTPALSVQFIKTYYTIYTNNKRVDSGVEEFFLFSKTIEEKKKLLFQSKIFTQKINKLTKFISKKWLFDPTDENLKESGKFRAQISKTGSIIRGITEISLAKELTTSLPNNSIIVLDGDLRTIIKEETEVMAQLFKKAKEKNILICGLSKTSHLLTNSGEPVHYVLNKLTNHTSWFYYPATKNKNLNHQAEICFVKLNSDSKHIFRLDIHTDSNIKENINLATAALSINSSDSIFKGYPYGLIEADRFARVSNKDTEYLKIRILTLLGDSSRDLEELFSSLNAHTILDNVS